MKSVPCHSLLKLFSLLMEEENLSRAAFDPCIHREPPFGGTALFF